LRVHNGPRKLVGIAEADVEALAGDRMQRLRGVADDDGACGRGIARVFEDEREGAAIAHA
jgi:hypothetical protein